jgi:hypothetical protein
VDSGETSPIKWDTDSDSINDDEELILGEDGYITDPLDMDSDDDGLTDGQEVAGWKVVIYWGDTKMRINYPSWSVSSNPNVKDTDNDELSDYEELLNFTHPNKIDTDGDGLSDYKEVHFWELYPDIKEFYELKSQYYWWEEEDEEVELPEINPTQFDKHPPSILYADVKHVDKGNWEYGLKWY